MSWRSAGDSAIRTLTGSSNKYAFMKTKSEAIGKDISAASVVDISPFGIWLHVRNVEYFLAYDQFPWFRDAPVSSVFEVFIDNVCPMCK